MPQTPPAGRLRLPFLSVVVVLAASGCAVPAAGLGGAQSAADAGNFPAALALADTALAQNPSDVQALILRSDIRRRQIAADTVGAVDAATVQAMVADARQATTLAPGDANARNNYLNVWLTSMSRGVLAYQATPPDLASASLLFRTATEVQPDSVQGHLNYGAVLLASGDASGAVAPLRTAARLEPGNATTARRLGRALLESDQGADAVTTLEAAADRFPDDAGIRTDLFAAYERAGRGNEALSRYERALQSPAPGEEPVLRFNYGTVLLRAGRIDDAIAQFERSIALQPDNADAHYNLGAAIQNQAAAINTRANATTDNAESARLVAERNALLERSLPHFEQARTLSDEGPSRTSSCTALFQVYTTLGRLDDARSVAACAGISMN